MKTNHSKAATADTKAMANSFGAAKKNIGPEEPFTDNRPEAVTQRKLQQAANANYPVPAPQKGNQGLPASLKSGIENLSGYSMDDVNVHYNSDKPSQLQAHAYAQGSDIHIARGQEKYLAHEAWHVVQQKQGRVPATKQFKGKTNINDDVSLEKEADVMGEKAMRTGNNNKSESSLQFSKTTGAFSPAVKSNVTQLAPVYIPGQNGPCHALNDTGGIAVGDFNDAKRTPVLNENHNRHGGNQTNQNTIPVADNHPIFYSEDGNGAVLKKNTVMPYLVEVDHILPKEKGGGNTPKNAQVLSSTQNNTKSDTYPHGNYTGTRVYCPEAAMGMPPGMVLETDHGTQSVILPVGVVLPANTPIPDNMPLGGDITEGAFQQGNGQDRVLNANTPLLEDLMIGAGTQWSGMRLGGPMLVPGGTTFNGNGVLPDNSMYISGTPLAGPMIFPANTPLLPITSTGGRMVIPAGTTFTLQTTLTDHLVSNSISQTNQPRPLPRGTQLPLNIAVMLGLAPAGHAIPH